MNRVQKGGLHWFVQQQNETFPFKGVLRRTGGNAYSLKVRAAAGNERMEAEMVTSSGNVRDEQISPPPPPTHWEALHFKGAYTVELPSGFLSSVSGKGVWHFLDFPSWALQLKSWEGRGCSEFPLVGVLVSIVKRIH